MFFNSRKQILLVLSFSFFVAAAQNKIKETSKHQPYHRVAIALSHAHIQNAIDQNGNVKWLIAAGWGFDYNYYFHKAFSFGLQVDMIIQDLKVEERLDDDNPHVVIERSHPVSLCPVISYKPLNNLTLVLGSGTEYCPEGQLFVTTFGVEYGKEFADNIEFGLGLLYSLKWQVYDTYMFSFVISKKLFRKK